MINKKILLIVILFGLLTKVTDSRNIIRCGFSRLCKYEKLPYISTTTTTTSTTNLPSTSKKIESAYNLYRPYDFLYKKYCFNRYRPSFGIAWLPLKSRNLWKSFLSRNNDNL